MRVVHRMVIWETLEEVLHPDQCAVLLVDLQNDFMRPEGKIAQSGVDVAEMIALLPRCASFLGTARELGVFVVHVQTITLAEGRSDSPSWWRAKSGGMAGDPNFALEGTWGAEICEECEPLPTEVVLTKHRSSAFHGTALDLILRSNGIQTVVVIGEQTPGCVEATYRDAAYHDYYNVLVEDCVAAFDRELHEASLKIQRARHDVALAREVIAIWQRARAEQALASPSDGVGRERDEFSRADP